jgi:hypothetical protein
MGLLERDNSHENPTGFFALIPWAATIGATGINQRESASRPSDWYPSGQFHFKPLAGRAIEERLMSAGTASDR